MDTTRVDRIGLKLALLLHGHDESSQEVGEDHDLPPVRAAMPTAFKRAGGQRRP